MSQKDALLNGAKHLEPVNLSLVGGPGEVFVRPITELEAGKISAIQQQGLSSIINIDDPKPTAEIQDLGQYMENMAKARVQTVAFGLTHSNEQWTVEDAGTLPKPQIQALYAVIQRLSGLRTPVIEGETSEEASFPVENGDSERPGIGSDDRDDDAPVGPGRDATG